LRRFEIHLGQPSESSKKNPHNPIEGGEDFSYEVVELFSLSSDYKIELPDIDHHLANAANDIQNPSDEILENKIQGFFSEFYHDHTRVNHEQSLQRGLHGWEEVHVFKNLIRLKFEYGYIESNQPSQQNS